MIRHPHVVVIAEAGVNHNGSLERALKLVDAAAEARADAVKFQTFRAGDVISRKAPKADYQVATTGGAESQLEMVRKLELTEPAHRALQERAEQRGIAFLSTPFDLASVRFLTHELALPTIKIGSGEITNAPLLLETARARTRIILSTGMSTLAEVRAALGVLAFGYTAPADAPPGRDAFQAAFAGDVGQAALHERVSLLHCTTEYPSPAEEANLRAMATLEREFGLPVGLSDHSKGIHIAIAAVALGARIIEKHFTLDRTLPGPDHAASLEPAELASMIEAVRSVEASLGDGVKRPTPSESKNLPIARKSLVAARAIRAGERFSRENLTTKRPGSGRSPFDYWSVLGTSATRGYEEDDVI
jgi:N-acetylneuraminate synthase